MDKARYMDGINVKRVYLITYRIVSITFIR
jgi:hypothetical protein